MTSIQQRVMHYAHILYNETPWELTSILTDGIESRWKEALRRAWELHYLREMLAHGIVEFTFIKKDGTLRTARGTNYPDLIPPRCAPSGRQQAEIEAGLTEPNWKSIPYYDLDKEAWRAFSIENFVQVNRVLAITPIECTDSAEKEKANKRKEPKEN